MCRMREDRLTEKTFTVDFFKKQGKIGGKKAAKALTKQERTEKARKAGASVSHEQAVIRAKKAAAARDAKRKAAKKD